MIGFFFFALLLLLGKIHSSCFELIVIDCEFVNIIKLKTHLWYWDHLLNSWIFFTQETPEANENEMMPLYTSPLPTDLIVGAFLSSNSLELNIHTQDWYIAKAVFC